MPLGHWHANNLSTEIKYNIYGNEGASKTPPRAIGGKEEKMLLVTEKTEMCCKINLQFIYSPTMYIPHSNVQVGKEGGRLEFQINMFIIYYPFAQNISFYFYHDKRSNYEVWRKLFPAFPKYLFLPTFTYSFVHHQREVNMTLQNIPRIPHKSRETAKLFTTLV